MRCVPQEVGQAQVIVTVILIAYALIGLWTLRRVAWIVAQDMSYGNRIEGDVLVLGLIMGFVGGALWPATILGLAVHYTFKNHSTVMLGLLTSAPRHVRQAEKIKALELEARERERHIRDLEYSTGVTKPPWDGAGYMDSYSDSSRYDGPY
jgi:hypothetical protein